MTYAEDFTVPSELLEKLRMQGLEAVPELIRVILNAAMQAPTGTGDSAILDQAARCIGRVD